MVISRRPVSRSGSNSGYRKSRSVLFLQALCMVLTGCSLSSVTPPSSKITISVPAGASGLRSRGSHSFSSAPPTVQDFDCIGVNISGEGIPVIRAKASCATSVVSDLGSYSTLVLRRTGGELSLSVSSGPKRKIQVYGITTSTGTCPSPESFIIGTSQSIATSPPYELGSTVIDVIGDTSVNVTSSWDSNQPGTAFCTDSINASSYWDSATWDTSTWAD